MLDASTSIHVFANALAERTPTPGGGATTALAAAMALAQGEMVVRFSIGRKTSTPQTDAMLTAAMATLSHGRALLLELMAEDQAAYEAYRATKSPEASARCLLIPQSVLASVLASAQALAHVASLLNPHLQADRIVTARLLIASAHSASALVATNLDASAAHQAIGAQTRSQVQRVEAVLGPLL
jgi:formiminotetrahydrofolate cyclodeaminase